MPGTRIRWRHGSPTLASCMHLWRGRGRLKRDIVLKGAPLHCASFSVCSTQARYICFYLFCLSPVSFITLRFSGTPGCVPPFLLTSSLIPPSVLNPPSHSFGEEKRNSSVLFNKLVFHHEDQSRPSPRRPGRPHRPMRRLLPRHPRHLRTHFRRLQQTTNVQSMVVTALGPAL
jgi:hypothetical protein